MSQNWSLLYALCLLLRTRFPVQSHAYKNSTPERACQGGNYPLRPSGSRKSILQPGRPTRRSQPASTRGDWRAIGHRRIGSVAPETARAWRPGTPPGPASAARRRRRGQAPRGLARGFPSTEIPHAQTRVQERWAPESRRPPIPSMIAPKMRTNARSRTGCFQYAAEPSPWSRTSGLHASFPIGTDADYRPSRQAVLPASLPTLADGGGHSQQACSRVGGQG